MVVPIAIGGFILSFVFDVVCLATGSVDPWATVAYYTMVGGIAGALCAAVPGFIDLLSLPAGPIKRVALTHMGLNLTVVVLYVANAWMRHSAGEVTDVHIGLSFVSLALLVVSGWLGGKMVYEMRVAVEDGETAADVGSRPQRGRQVNA
jgi:uncharacterized membrane protein